LSATNGRVNLTRELLAMGTEAGQVGGAISALAPNVKLSDKALVSASGASGGGAIALLGVNGEPAKSIDIAKGATLDASATTSGQGGTVSVSADGIEFRGAAFARGGEKSGDGGRVGLTGAISLVVDGGADAGAQAGKAGVLALNYGQAQTRIDTPVADTISRTLRTGTNVEVDAACRGATCDGKERRIVVSSRIDGRPDAETGVGNAGAALSIRADAIVVSNDVYTNDGDITLHGRTGFVQMRQPTSGTLAPGRVEPILFAGTGDIDITAAKDVVVHHLLTKGDVRLTSIGGNVEMWQRLGRDEYGPLKSLTIRALGTPASDAEVATVGNVRRLRDVAVATDGAIDIQVTRNIRLLEGAQYIDGQLTDNRIGLTAARKGEGGRKLIMQSARLSETGDLTASDWYWGTGTETNVNSQIYHLGADKNADRPADGRWADLTKTIKDTDTPTITPPGPNNLSERTKLARIDPLQPSIRADGPARLVVPDVAQAPPGSETAAPSSPTPELVAQTPDIKQAATEGAGAFPVALLSPRPSDQAESARNIVDREGVVVAEEGALETTETAGGYSGGRGVAQSADVGRTRLAEAPRDVFEIVEHVVEIKQCAAPVAAGNTYFTTGAFGQTLSTSCR
jgi:hypothetical protein